MLHVCESRSIAMFIFQEFYGPLELSKKATHTAVNYLVERGEHEPSKFLNNTVRGVRDEYDKLKAIA